MGRKSLTNHAKDLSLARDIMVEGMTFEEACKVYGLASKRSVHVRMQAIKAEHPEYMQYLEELSRFDPHMETIEQTTNQLNRLEEANKQLPKSTQNNDLANKIEKIIDALISMTPADISTMKPEHRLRNIDPLVKAMRLLREESTENTKSISLIRMVAIATARRKPAE